MKSTLLFILFFSTNFLFSQSNSECLDCHIDNELTNLRKGKEISLFVNESQFNKSAHKKLKCSECHTNFDAEDIPHKSGTDIYKVDCANCHEKEVAQMKTDIHQRLKNKTDKEKPECLTCHTHHNIKPSNLIGDKSKFFCSDCHEDKQQAEGFHKKVFVSAQGCADCHEHEKDVEEHSLQLAKSVHKDLECSDCHTYAAQNLEHHEEIPVDEVEKGCATCHTEIVDIHQESIHHVKYSQGAEDAASCSHCHGSHEILAKDNPESKVYPKNLAETCGSCHDDPEFAEKNHMSVNRPGQMYSNSVHGKLVMEGDTTAASCTSCHGIHDIKNRIQKGSKISALNLPNTCVECHEEEVNDYKNSVHWMRVQRGIKDAPVCNDCHNEHSIQELNAEGRESNRLKMQNETCIACHEDSRVAKKYGKKGNQVEEYLDSYHGLAATRGDNEAALCVDCHNVHSILPSKNPMASTHPDNVTETCRACHEDGTEIFAKSYSHETESESARSIENMVSSVYFWLIVAVIGGMLLHNFIIFFFEAKRKRRKEKNAITMPRFTRNEVIQHVLLATSFIILAMTGFALKYPDSFWAEGLRTLGMSETIRQFTHRTSAVIMGVLSIYHVIYLFFTKRGRDVLVEMLPNFSDLRAIRENLNYYLGIAKKYPQFEMYDYAEKAEYWALIWGTFVMGATGFFLWFPTTVGDWAPLWLIKVSEIIHFMEAILASLAILVWHWFFVMFRPSQYPMSFTWMDGKMTLDHYRHHHERHFRRIIMEYYEYTSETQPREKLTNYTSLFKNTLEKSGFKLEDVIQGELNKDLELRVWYENEIAELEANI